MLKDPLTKGHLLMTSDISPLMQEVLIKRFKEAGFTNNKSNSFYSCADDIQGKELSFSDEE